MSYEALLSDGGSASGGPHQRVAPACALVRPPLFLLLDGVTSVLDTIPEREVRTELGRVRCTRLVIAHRPSTIMAADRILMMESGRLVEKGTRADLWAKKGFCAKVAATRLDGAALP